MSKETKRSIIYITAGIIAALSLITGFCCVMCVVHGNLRALIPGAVCLVLLSVCGELMDAMDRR